MNQNQQKISLVGVGRVGSMLALTILMKGLAKEMVLVGENNHQAQGEVYDPVSYTHLDVYKRQIDNSH